MSSRAPSPPVWRVDPQLPTVDQIAPAVSIIRQGGVVVYPTETYYGLGGHPELPAAVKKIYHIKGRDFQKPLPVIAVDLEAVRKTAAAWTPAAERLASAFWPGPLTLVLSASPALPPELLAQTGTVAVRISSHPVSQLLAAAVGGVLIATSANLSGQPPSRRPEDLSMELVARVDGIIDGGETAGHAPSTVVDVTADPARLLRKGAIPWPVIMRFLFP